jgi:hypothetical protein
MKIKRSLKNILYSIFNATGIFIVRRDKYKGSAKFNLKELSYGTIFPPSNYSPWLGDTSFKNIFMKVELGVFSLVDQYRAYELWQLTERIQTVNPGVSILEVGVWRGGHRCGNGSKTITYEIIGKFISCRYF